MRAPLVKLYIIIAAALIATVMLVPSIVSRTSEWAVLASTQADLALYNRHNTDDALVNDDMACAVIVMDDGWQTQYTRGYKMLSRYGFKACIAVVPSFVDDSGYMTYRQLAEVYMDGWDLLNHTYDHVDLTALDPNSQTTQLTATRDWLEKHKFMRGSNVAVYPNGSFTEETIQALKENGFAAGLSLRTVWDAETGYTREDIEVCNLLSDRTFYEIKQAIDKAVNNKSAVIFMLHKIEPVTEDSKMQLSEEMLLQVADYLNENKDRIRVVTMTELLGAA